MAKVSEISFVPARRTCHICARKLDSISEDGPGPNAGMCDKHGVSYDRSYKGSDNYEVDIVDCPECESNNALSDQESDVHCPDCGYDDYSS